MAALPVGSNALFTVTAAGTPPLSYQWQFNGADIPGATNLTLALASLALTNAGNYQLVVSNALGTVASATLGTEGAPMGRGDAISPSFSSSWKVK